MEPFSGLVPEIGQMVRVRGRNFVVTHLKSSAIADARASTFQPGRLLVEVASLDDEGLGEEASFLWGIEPGAEIIGKVALPKPTGFDAPLALDTFLLALKWSAISSADDRPLPSPFRSGIEIEDFQLDPLVRSLRMPRAKLLIANDADLGKPSRPGSPFRNSSFDIAPAPFSSCVRRGSSSSGNSRCGRNSAWSSASSTRKHSSSSGGSAACTFIRAPIIPNPSSLPTPLDLGHGFHATKQGERFTISEPNRRTVLDRLFDLNHQHCQEEVVVGLHEKKRASGTGVRRPGKMAARKAPNGGINSSTLGDLFSASDS